MLMKTVNKTEIVLMDCSEILILMVKISTITLHVSAVDLHQNGNWFN
jgi:hypothetical protein